MSPAEGLVRVPMSVYMERGIPLPAITAPFAMERPMLPAGRIGPKAVVVGEMAQEIAARRMR